MERLERWFWASGTEYWQFSTPGRCFAGENAIKGGSVYTDKDEKRAILPFFCFVAKREMVDSQLIARFLPDFEFDLR